MRLGIFLSAVKNKISIVVPIFSGSVGEGTLIRSLEELCRDKDVEVIPVRCSPDKASLTVLAEKISNAGMLCLSDCDESPAVIAAILKTAEVSKAITALRRSCGLIYGCGAGFSALLRLGLINGGELAEEKENTGIAVSDAPLSGLVRKQTLVRASSVGSPFMAKAKSGEIYRTEISSYAGRVVGDGALLGSMGERGLIPTQYCDPSGNAAMDTRYNPCASLMAVDSLASEDGVVLGQISFPLRAKCCSDSYLRDIEHLPIIESAIDYLS